MYCRNCGRKIEDDRELCEECEAKLKTETVNNDAQKVEVVEEVVNNNPINDNSSTNSNSANTTSNNGARVTTEQKSKLAAGLFGIFLGTFGVHNFYLGFTGKAVAQLLITVLSCGFLSPVSGIWGLIEGILILSGDQKKDASGVPLKD